MDSCIDALFPEKFEDSPKGKDRTKNEKKKNAKSSKKWKKPKRFVAIFLLFLLSS